MRSFVGPEEERDELNEDHHQTADEKESESRSGDNSDLDDERS